MALEEHTNEKMAETQVLKTIFGATGLIQLSLPSKFTKLLSPGCESLERGSHWLWLEERSGPSLSGVPLLPPAPSSLTASLSHVQALMEPLGVGVLSLSKEPSIFKPFPLLSPTPPHPQFNVPLPHILFS